MSSFEGALSRMKDLYTYGKDLNESNKSSVYTLEYSAKAADGNTYGIIRECNKYYIKTATKGKERLAEEYNYLGGFCNKKNYEYTSYNSALKNFELKMASINEACDANVNIATLDPFKKGDFIVEGTEKMRNEIARQRQIMYNASMIMNESTDINVSRKNDVVKYDGKQPEAETGKKGTEGMIDAKANPEYTGSKTNGVNKKVAPFNTNAPKCEDQLKESCACEGDSCSCGKDWGSEGIGKGRDPKTIGWDIDDQTQVNEEEDWASKGLPSTPGVGEADTDKNNMPFNKNINEEDESVIDVDFGMEDDDLDAEEEMDDFDAEEEMDDFDAEEEMDDFDAEEEMDDFDAEEEMDDLESETTEIESLRAELESLRAEIERLKKGDFEMEKELDGELDDEEEVDDLDTEKEMNDFDAEEDMGDFDAEEDMDDFDAEEDVDIVAESKKRIMNSIIESVVNDILNEDELHAFGKHPGYQKKPMELPETGSDKNQWGEDWNDESVYSEQPFGTQKGNSAPFEKLVDSVTKTVMSKLSEEINGKKKVK